MMRQPSWEITEAQKHQLHCEMVQYYQRYGMLPQGIVSTPATVNAFATAAQVPGSVHVTGRSRCGDADRDACLAYLREMLAQGYLSHEEFSAREDAALAALTADELTALKADLPVPAKKEPPKRTALDFFPPGAYLSWAVTMGILALLYSQDLVTRWVLTALGAGYMAAFAIFMSRKSRSG